MSNVRIGDGICFYLMNVSCPFVRICDGMLMLRVAQSSMSLACLCLNHLKMSLQALALAQTGGCWISGGYRERNNDHSTDLVPLPCDSGDEY
jgi:hypothetical protein